MNRRELRDRGGCAKRALGTHRQMQLPLSLPNLVTESEEGLDNRAA